MRGFETPSAPLGAGFASVAAEAAGFERCPVVCFLGSPSGAPPSEARPSRRSFSGQTFFDRPRFGQRHQHLRCDALHDVGNNLVQRLLLCFERLSFDGSLCFNTLGIDRLGFSRSLGLDGLRGPVRRDRGRIGDRLGTFSDRLVPLAPGGPRRPDPLRLPRASPDSRLARRFRAVPFRREKPPARWPAPPPSAPVRPPAPAACRCQPAPAR